MQVKAYEIGGEIQANVRLNLEFEISYKKFVNSKFAPLTDNPNPILEEF